MPQERQQHGAPAAAVHARRRGTRRPVLTGLGISLVVHAVILLAYGSLARMPETRTIIVPVPPIRSEASGIRVLRVAEVAAPELGDPLDPEPIEAVEQPEVGVEAPELVDEGAAFIPRHYRSAAERLRLTEGDPRLWASVAPELLEASDEDILQARLAILIAEGNDSVLAEAEALARSMDWTYTDEDGKRWGLSPGMIHLGDIAVPLPFGFGAPYDFSGDRAELGFRFSDIQRAAGTLAARQSWRERVEAMRKRREERRAEEQAARAGTGSTVQPDTTSHGPRFR